MVQHEAQLHQPLRTCVFADKLQVLLDFEQGVIQGLHNTSSLGTESPRHPRRLRALNVGPRAPTSCNGDKAQSSQKTKTFPQLPHLAMQHAANFAAAPSRLSKGMSTIWANRTRACERLSDPSAFWAFRVQGHRSFPFSLLGVSAQVLTCAR